MSSKKVAQSTQSSEVLGLFRDLNDAQLASINGGVVYSILPIPQTPFLINPQDPKLGLTLTIPLKINKNTGLPL